MHLFKNLFEDKNINRLFWFSQLFPKMWLKLKKKGLFSVFQNNYHHVSFLFFTELFNSVFNNQ